MRKQTVLVLLITASAGWAQRADTAGTVRQIMSGGQAQSAPASQSVESKWSQPSTAQPADMAAASSSNKLVRAKAIAAVQPKPGSGEKTVAPGEVVAKRPHMAGKRDPFVSPIVERAGAPAGACGVGKRCLVIDQILLRGVVRTATGMIAVVANSANKAYFLRENDPVFNGYVVKITADSVVFKENTVDAVGHTGSREVVKRVNTPAV